MALYFFYFFAFTAILSSFLVIFFFANNPVHSVLWLILTFFSVAGFFILVGRIFSSTSNDCLCRSVSGLISVRSYDAQY